MTRQFAYFALCACLLAVGFGMLPNRAAGQAESTAAVEAVIERPGAEVYARACAVCHGKEGHGLEEAKTSFPESHRKCTRCHRPGNPPVMSLLEVEMRQNDLFDVGIAPPLRGEGSMPAIADREALLHFISATMPRYRPGSLEQEEYEAVTDYLLSLNGRNANPSE